MAAVEWHLKREKGNRSVTMTAEQADVQAFVENELRTYPDHGACVVYQRYASCAPDPLPKLTWTMGTPPAPPAP